MTPSVLTATYKLVLVFNGLEDLFEGSLTNLLDYFEVFAHFF